MFFKAEFPRNDYSTWIKNNVPNMFVSDGYGRLARGGQVPRHFPRSRILGGSTSSNESSARSNTTGSEKTRTPPSRSCIETQHHGSSGIASQQMSREKLHTVGHSNKHQVHFSMNTNRNETRVFALQPHEQMQQPIVRIFCNNTDIRKMGAKKKGLSRRN